MSSKIFLLWCVSLLAVNVALQRPTHPVSVMQINAQWNEENSLPLDSLQRCNVYNEWIEDHPKTVRENLPTIPIVVVYWEGEEVATFSGNVTLRQPVTLDSLRNLIDSLYEEDRQNNSALFGYP